MTEKPLEAYGAPDPVRDQVNHELNARLRQRFVENNTGTGHNTPFVMSLATARWDDCRKDIERGHITEAEARRILAVAIRHRLFVGFAAEYIYNLVIPKGETPQ